MKAQENQEYKKQALQFIISLYLNRKNEEDIRFLYDNIGSTNNFATNVGSSIKQGLGSQADIYKNKNIYGKNSRKIEKKTSVIDILKHQFKINHFLTFGLCISQFILGNILNKKQLFMDAVYIFIFTILAILIRIFTLYINQEKKAEHNLNKNKNQKYRVLRGQNFIQIPQTKLVVGDIIELDYKETVPASGILISSSQISVCQELYGRKIQRKMNLQKCVSYIKKLTLLQLKIDSQKDLLPSPIILRGSQQVYGPSYRMMVLAVDQNQLLNRYIVRNQNGLKSAKIDEWFSQFQKKSQKILHIACLIYLVLFAALFILKQYIQRNHLSIGNFVSDFCNILQIILISNSLFSISNLKVFFQSHLLNYSISLQNSKQLDRYLTVQQLYITQDNIVKYDEVKICQIGFSDRQTINFEDRDILNNGMKTTIQQILNVVGLVKDSQNELNNSKNSQIIPTQMIESMSMCSSDKIIHLNTVDQKIFSSLHNPSAQNESKQSKENNHINEQNLSNIQLNKIKPLQEVFTGSNSFRQSGNCEMQFSIKKSKGNKKLKQNNLKESKNNHEDMNTLTSYLGEHCNFKTQNIVQGIVKLAKQSFRTYYYQKYTPGRLQKISKIYISKDSVIELTKQKFQKIKRTARNIRIVENLTPYLIGYSEGAYNNNYMNVFVAVLGVNINYENDIIQKLNQLYKLGIKSTILIFRKNEDELDEEEYDDKKRIVSQYINRGWISHQIQQVSQFSNIKEAGGIIRCENCYLQRCFCKNRNNQVSDIQSFMTCIENTKIVHSIDNEADINYLQTASQQLKESTITINKYKSDTIKILNDIKNGYYLTKVFENGLTVWFGFLILQILVLYFFALISFGGVFSGSLLSVMMVFSQILSLIGYINIKDIQIQAKEELSCQSRQKKLIFTTKSSLSILLLYVMTMIVCAVFYINPDLIPHKMAHLKNQIFESYGLIFDTEKISISDCYYERSIFLSNDFSSIICTDNSNNQTIIIYSQNLSFLYGVITLNILFFVMFTFKNIFNWRFCIIYMVNLGFFLLTVYGIPDSIHGVFYGITGIKFVLMVGISLGTNLLIKLTQYLHNKKWISFQTQEFESLLEFQKNIDCHYSAKLKKYSHLQTQVYILK